MDWLTYLNAVILGIVEGLTEFIPVSSTGHLILLIDLLNFKSPPGKVFEIVIQLGAISAICWLYREKLCKVAFNLHREPDARRFTLLLLLAFLPAMVIGLLAHDFIKNVLFSPWVVSVMLVVGGVLILLIEKSKPRAIYERIEAFPLPLAVKIGFCQALAMIPGVSRSGATIMGALLLKVERKAATEFSFFLAIPTMLAATTYDLYKNMAFLNTDSLMLIAVGFFSAFFAALLVVRTVVGFVSRHGFAPFAIYRIIIGTIMIALLAAGRG